MLLKRKSIRLGVDETTLDQLIGLNKRMTCVRGNLVSKARPVLEPKSSQLQELLVILHHHQMKYL